MNVPRFWKRLSMKWRLTLLFTAGMALLLLILDIFIFWGTSNIVYHHEQRLLQQKVRAIASDLVTQVVEESSLSAAYLTRLLTNYSDINLAILLLDDQGKRLASVVGSAWKDDPWEIDEKMLTAQQQIHLPASSAPLTIQIMEQTQPLEAFFHVLLAMITLASLATLVISGLGGNLLTRIGLKPLNQLIVHIREMSAAQLSTRLPSEHVSHELRELVTAFNSLLDRVEEVVEMQQQFVADASHELRTPLAIIEGYLSLLQRWGKNKPEVREEALAAMQQECDRLFRLIEDLLSLAKLERQPFASADIQEQSLVPLLQEVQHAWSSVFPAHIELQVSWEEPLTAAVDRGKIRQLLDILLDNARKYTEQGHVSLNAYVKEGMLHIHVVDTGIGIPPDEIQHIFSRFYRVEKSRNRNRGGSGLGLAIAQRIVKAHHGKIEVSRAATGGTHVHVKLPGRK